MENHTNEQEQSNKPAAETPSHGGLLPGMLSAVEFFHDGHREAYAFVNGEVIPIKGKNFKHWIGLQYWNLYKDVPKANFLKDTINAVEAEAIFKGPQKVLHNRVARTADALWYDLGDGRAVRVTAEGWEVVAAPILFIRHPHQQPQALPVSGGDLYKIFSFLNVSEDDKLLLLVYIISCFIDDIAHPLLHPHGAQGSGKTTLFKALKRLCDPSSLETLITPKDQNELIRYLSRHHLCLFDNMSEISSQMSDVLAQACTGGSYTKRQLYTDDDDVIFSVKKIIGLNGINSLIAKPDLMDRSILICLERIVPSQRTDEATLWKAFEDEKPGILGGIFDVLSKALSTYPNVKLDKLPRMADFAKWGYAIAEALGSGGEKFLQAYEASIRRQGEEVIHGNTLAQAVLTFIAERDSWTGTVKEAWLRLKETADPDKADPTFPKAERMLKTHLDRIKTTLMDKGISYIVGKREGRGIPLTFKRSSDVATFRTFPTSTADKLTAKPTAGRSFRNRIIRFEE